MSRKTNLTKQGRRNLTIEGHAESFARRYKALLILSEAGDSVARGFYKAGISIGVQDGSLCFSEIPQEKRPSYDELFSFWKEGHKTDESDIAA